MSFDAIILMPLVAGFGFLYWASQLDDEHPILKLLFQFMFFPLAFLSVQFAVIDAALNYSSDSALVVALANFTQYLGYLLFAVGVYYLFVVLNAMWVMFQNRKQEKSAETFGDNGEA